MAEPRPPECVIIGGGAAGLSAALVLGRARRRVLLVDEGRQSNRPAPGVGGFLGNDGSPPEALYAAARAELAAYPSVEVRAGRVASARREDGGFVLRLATGGEVRARLLLLAEGMAYGVPDIPGAAELWGGAVFHCPFCHGWEVRGRPLAVLGSGGEGARRALLLRMWSPDVVLAADGPAGLTAGLRGRVARAGVAVEERRVVRLEAAPGDGRPGLAGLRLADGALLRRDGLLVTAPPRLRSSFAEDLGAELTERGTVWVDDLGRTTVPGLFAAGDLAARLPQVATAVAAGSVAATAMVHDLVEAAFA